MAAPSQVSMNETAASTARGLRVRRTALVLGVVAAVFYVGSMFILVWRGHQ